METLGIVLAALARLSPAAADGSAVARWRSYVAEAAGRFSIPAEWINRVMDLESNGRLRLNGAPVTSRAGAMGLMQVTPDAWDEMRRLHRLGRDPYDPHDNIMAGAGYLSLMYRRFGYPGLFAAYNAGPARYARYLAAAGPLPAETAAYVNRLAGGLLGLPRPGPSGPARSMVGVRASPIFAVGGPATTGPAVRMSQVALFAVSR